MSHAGRRKGVPHATEEDILSVGDTVGEAVLTASEAAKRTGLSARTIARRCAAGTLRGWAFQPEARGRHIWLASVAAVDALVRDRALSSHGDPR